MCVDNMIAKGYYYLSYFISLDCSQFKPLAHNLPFIQNILINECTYNWSNAIMSRWNWTNTQKHTFQIEYEFLSQGTVIRYHKLFIMLHSILLLIIYILWVTPTQELQYIRISKETTWPPPFPPLFCVVSDISKQYEMLS